MLGQSHVAVAIISTPHLEVAELSAAGWRYFGRALGSVDKAGCPSWIIVGGTLQVIFVFFSIAVLRHTAVKPSPDSET